MRRISALLFVFAVGVYQLTQTIVERELVWTVILAVALLFFAAQFARGVMRRASRG